MTAIDDALAWLDAERPNVLAAADYAATHEQQPYVQAIAVAMADFMYAHGDWAQLIALHKIALATALQAGDQHGQALSRMELGIMEAMSGDAAAAAASLATAVALYRDLGDERGQAWSLSYLAHFVYLRRGDYAAAIAGHERALALARSAGDQFAEAAVLDNLGWVQLLVGEYQASAESLASALDLSRALGYRYGEARAMTDIGQLRRLIGDYPAAAASLRQALEIYRDLGYRPDQADALVELGRVEQLTGDYPAAAASLHQALELHRATGSPGFETLNQLGELSTLTSDTRQARAYHAEALAGARDLGWLPDEACALEGIGRSHLHDGDHVQAAAYLRQALGIYQRIGSPHAQRVQEVLHNHDLASGS